MAHSDDRLFGTATPHGAFSVPFFLAFTSFGGRIQTWRGFCEVYAFCPGPFRSGIAGHAHIAAWPGDAEISTGKVDGDRIIWTVIGKIAYDSKHQGVTTSGYPKLVFDGTLTEGEITIMLDWGSILTTGEEETELKLPMKARRVVE